MKTRRDERRRAVMGPRDAWVLARIMADLPINGELGEMSDRWRPFAERLHAKAPDLRLGVLEGYSYSMADPCDPARDIADAMPDRPAPSLEEQRAWEEGEAGGPAAEAVTIAASEVEPLPVEWLWRDRVPLGMLTLFSGDPKLGKSLATLSMIAYVSRGHGLPGDPATVPAGSAILLSAEDDPARTLVPRLKAAGAVLERVHLLSAIREPEDPDAGDPAGAGAVERMPTLAPYHLQAIERRAAALGDCRLIVIDPVSAYLGDCDDHRNSELRAVLTPLKEMAERLGAAVVLVTHHNKAAAAGTNGKYRVLGSIAYVGTCRANFLFHEDPDDAEGRRVLMLDNGGNLAPKQPGLAYRLRDLGDGPFCDWQPDTVDLDADEVLAKAAKAARASRSDKGGEPRGETAKRRCVEWLETYLAAGKKPSEECENAAKAAGHSRTTLYRARTELDVQSLRIQVGDQVTHYWYVPEGRPEPGVAEPFLPDFGPIAVAESQPV